MKWMIASDIHGSAKYCRKLFERFEAERADRLLLLGDLLYHGPRNDEPEGYDTRETTRLLNAYADKLMVVRGNCDAEVDQMVLDFPIMAEYALLDFNGHLLFATHGHVFSPQNLPKLRAGDVLLCGHTHVPACKDVSGITYINPGSVSLPKEASPHSYMIMENGFFTWKDLNGVSYMSYPSADI